MVSQSRDWMEALGIMKPDQEKIVWFWVGSHSEYDTILSKN